MKTITTCLFLGLILMTTGCRSTPTQSDEAVRLLADMPYPEQADDGGPLNMQVVRNGPQITISNLTARRFENVQLWLNKTHVNVIEVIEIGPDNTYLLADFIDRYRKPFPVAKFLQPDAAGPVVLTELYDPQTKQRYQLTTRISNQQDLMRRAR